MSRLRSSPPSLARQSHGTRVQGTSPTLTDINTDDTRDSSQLGLSSGPILLFFFSAQCISDTEGEEKMVGKCKRWNDH